VARDREMSRTGFRADPAATWLDFFLNLADGHGPLSAGAAGRGAVLVVTDPVPAEPTERDVPLGELGERLSALRLCEPAAVEAMQQSLTRYGQLSALVVFGLEDRLELVDGFKRLQAARRLGWRELRVRQGVADALQATVQIAALHTGCGLTELEEGWVVRALYRDHGLSQPAIAMRLARHKSWVCRRLLLVEALDNEVQARVRLGLLAPRAAVALTALPRGNQLEASDLVVQRSLTVRQTELLTGQLLECEGDAARASLLARWASGELAPQNPGRPPARANRSEADCLASDIVALHRLVVRLQTRLLAAPLRVLGPTAAELLAQSLESLAPVLTTLALTIASVTTPQSQMIQADKARGT
jgi:ParB-like chromosome segregation protein Spo0J